MLELTPFPLIIWSVTLGHQPVELPITLDVKKPPYLGEVGRPIITTSISKLGNDQL